MNKKQEAVKTDVLTSDLDELWSQYMQYLRQASEADQPIWVKYNPEPDRSTYHVIASITSDGKEAEYHLYRAETFINNLFRSKGIYINNVRFGKKVVDNEQKKVGWE